MYKFFIIDVKFQYCRIVLLSVLIFSFLDSYSQKSTLHVDTLTAVRLTAQADSLIDVELYSEAFEVLNEAGNIYSKHKFWRNAIKCDIELSIVADNFDSPDLKIQHSNQAVIVAIKYLEKNDILLASAYRQKAEALMWIEQLDSANLFLKAALPIFISEEDWVEYGWTEVLLAVNHINTYQLDSSEYHLGKLAGLLDTQELPLTDFEDLQSTLFDLRGVTYELIGDYNKAIKNLNEAVELSLNIENISILDSGFISNQFNTLGSIYLAKGDYVRAEDNFLQVIRYDKNALFDPVLLNNIGLQYIKQEKYLIAIAYFEKSANLSIQDPVSSPEQKISSAKNSIEALNNLCSCYRTLGKYEQAVAYCQKAEAQQIDHKKYITWASMGRIFIEQNKPDKAVDYLNKAIKDLAHNAKSFHDKILTKSKILYLLGEAHFQNENLKMALSFYQKSLVANHRDFSDSLDLERNPSLSGIYKPIYFLETTNAKAKTQALVAFDTPSLTVALSTYQLAIQWIDSLQVSYALESSQINWSTKFKSIYEEAINTCFKLYTNTGDVAFIELAFNFSEKSRSSILLEQLKSKKGKYTAGIPDSLLQLGKDLQVDIVFYQEKLAAANEQNENAKIKLYQGYLSQSRLNLASLEEKLEVEYPKFHQVKYAPDHITIKQVQKDLLDNDSALLEYFLGNKTAFVFVISKEKVEMIPIEEFEKMKSNISDFLHEMTDVESFKRNTKAAFADYNLRSFAMYSQLLAIPLEIISNDIQHLIIVPDDNLNSVPFEALTDKVSSIHEVDFAKLPFLIYKYEFQYSYSAQLLLENKLRQADLPPNMDCFGLAPSYHATNPISMRGDLDQLRNTSGDLSGTANEIAQISKYVSGMYCVGETATESLFKAEADKYGILHLAMHGEATLENPNYNHLKFSNKTNNSAEDNLLYQYEISNMDLNAQLVVLSACETGLGKYEKGEGVFSLARSFMYAGVPSVVMSLWRVSDASTSKLMPYFYENMSKDKSKVTALRDAKLSYLESADLTMRHPFYWSAFVVIGDGSALKSSSNNFFYWAIGALFLLVVGGLIWNKRNTIHRKSE